MPTLRTDLIHAYLFRRQEDSIELLQFRRTQDPLAGSWQPVMGHLHQHETAVEGAAREIREETGLDVRSSSCRGWYALESVHPFFLPHSDAVILSPSFAVEIDPSFTPKLCEEHDHWRIVHESNINDCFMWPGQRASASEIRSLVLRGLLAGLPR